MPDDVVGFNDNDANALLRLIGAEGGEVPQFRHPGNGLVSSIAKADSTIAAGSSTSPSSGAGALQSLVSGSWSAGTAVTLYNPWPVVVAAGVPLPVSRINGGIWIITSPSLSQVTAITDNQVDTTNKTIEEKTQAFHAPGVQTESGWTVWHTGDTC